MLGKTKYWFAALVATLLLSGCGGGGGGSDSSGGGASSTYDRYDTWVSTGKYDYCSDAAEGTYRFAGDGRIYTTLVYEGEDWHSDCSVNPIGKQTLDISALRLSPPLTRDGMQRLFTYLYETLYGEGRWQVDISVKSDDTYEIYVYDYSDGSTEVISMRLPGGSGGGSAFALYVGSYQGSYSGDDRGSWELTIGADGVVGGTAHSGTYGEIALSGRISDRDLGTLVVGNASYGVTFNGQIDTNTGAISGTWRNDNGYSGTFSGYKQR